LHKIFAYILTGLLFSFPFLSPALGLNIIPSLQIGYLTLLQTNEEKSKTAGPDDSRHERIENEKSKRNLKANTFLNGKLKRVKLFADAIWSHSKAADKILQNQCQPALKAATYHKHTTLLSVKSVVLRR
jgi:hypothetical protein